MGEGDFRLGQQRKGRRKPWLRAWEGEEEEEMKNDVRTVNEMTAARVRVRSGV